MGFEQLENLREPLRLRDFGGGLFFNKDRTAVPDNAATNCDRVMWLNRRLTRTPGFAKTNTSALNGGAVGLGGITFLNDSNNVVGVFGNKIYEDCSTTTPADITGAYGLSATERVQFYEFKEGANKYIIGVQKGTAPFKWTGAGNIAALGGSPPNCKWIEGYNKFVFLANAANAENRVYWSGLTAPETWDTVNQYFSFPTNVTGMKAFKGDLYVFMPDRIGKISGFGSDTFSQTNEFVNTIGCVSGYTIKSAKIIIGNTERDVLIFLSKDGPYALDGSPDPIKLSVPIEKRFTGGALERLNQEYLVNASADTVRADGNFYVLTVPGPTAITNNIVYWVDLNHVQQLDDGSAALAFWPMSSMNASMMVSRYRDTDRDDLYFLSTDGYAKKFSFTTMSEDGSGKVAYWYGKTVDFYDHVQIRECNVIGEYDGDFGLDVSLIWDVAADSQSTTFTAAGDKLDTTFILDVSQLADIDFVMENVSGRVFGRFGQIRFAQDATSSPTPDSATFTIEGVDLYLKDLGLRSTYVA